MKMPMSTPLTSASHEPIANGENHDSSGWMDPAGASAYTRTSATTANSARVTTSAVSSQRCVLALSSMPMTQIQVIAAMKTTPSAVTASVEASSTPNSRYV